MIIYSRTSLALTPDGNLTKLLTMGPHQDELRVSDSDNNDLLMEIFNQLRVLNFQISTITENSLDEIWE